MESLLNPEVCLTSAAARLLGSRRTAGGALVIRCTRMLVAALEDSELEITTADAHQARNGC